MMRSQSLRKSLRVALGGWTRSRPRLRPGSDAYGASANTAFAMKSAVKPAQLTFAAAALTYHSGADATMSPGGPRPHLRTTTDATMTEVTITERAARQIGKILKAEPAGAMLRLSVLGGGCSGFQYKFDVEKTKADDDQTIVRNGVIMLVDSISLQYLAGSEVD